jgi:hypothetical protein
MTNNPLIAKWEELHNSKKEEPKKVELEGTVKLAQEQVEQLKKLPYTHLKSSRSVKTYDIDSCKDSFLQIAEKVKNGTSSVTSASMEIDMMGRSKVIFEVYDGF